MKNLIRPITVLPAMSLTVPHPLHHLIPAFCGGVFIELFAYVLAADIKRKKVKNYEK